MKDYGWQVIKGKVPSKSNMYRIGDKRLFKSQALQDYEASFLWQSGSYRKKGISKPFEFYCRVFYPSKRSDLDNALKVLLDCLQKCEAITNDNNCYHILAEKFIDADNPRVEFRIVEID